MAATAISLQDRIQQSRRARAVQRAWAVAKSLEGDRPQLAKLTWVEPRVEEGKGITRRIDFGRDFPPSEVPVLMPIPLAINVHAPANLLVPGEDMPFSWTMPLLTRMGEAQALSLEVASRLSGQVGVQPKVRPVVELVTFLPFPRVDAPPQEEFSTEFGVSITVDQRFLGKQDNFFAAIVRHNGKLIAQPVNETRTSLFVVADPYHQALFKAEMLVSLSQDELALTPADAGTIDIFLYRVMRQFDIKFFDLGTRTREMDTFGSDLFRGGGSRSLGSITGGAGRNIPSPAAAPKEVGDVRVSEGTRGERVHITSLDGYVVDTAFAVQQISIRCLGVREGSRDVLLSHLAGM